MNIKKTNDQLNVRLDPDTSRMINELRESMATTAGPVVKQAIREMYQRRATWKKGKR